MNNEQQLQRVLEKAGRIKKLHINQNVPTVERIKYIVTELKINVNVERTYNLNVIENAIDNQLANQGIEEIRADDVERIRDNTIRENEEYANSARENGLVPENNFETSNNDVESLEDEDDMMNYADNESAQDSSEYLETNAEDDNSVQSDSYEKNQETNDGSSKDDNQDSENVESQNESSNEQNTTKDDNTASDENKVEEKKDNENKEELHQKDENQNNNNGEKTDNQSQNNLNQNSSKPDENTSNSKGQKPEDDDKTNAKKAGNDKGNTNQNSNKTNNDTQAERNKNARGNRWNRNSGNDGAKKAGTSGKDDKVSKAKNAAEKLKKQSKTPTSKPKSNQNPVEKAKQKAKQKAKEAVANFIKKNPKVALVLLAAAALLMLIVIISGLFASLSGSADPDGNSAMGRDGLAYVSTDCDEITVVKGDEEIKFTLEEYVAGVVAGEFGYFANDNKFEAAKAGAVAARTYVLRNTGSDCRIVSSSARQNYSTPTTETIKAAEETKGVILVNENNELISTEYDAFCTEVSQDDPNYYIICQNEQKIPRSWVDSNAIKAEWKDGSKTGAHGRGMSQWGAAYLAEEQGYTYMQILAYYYPDAVFGTNIKSVTSEQLTYSDSDNFIYEKNKNGATILDVPLKSLLGDSGIRTLNNLIHSNVLKAGVGTREAIATAAITPIKYLFDENNMILPYVLGGGHSGNYFDGYNKVTDTYYGVDPDWGTMVSYYGGTPYGPDCSGFVKWVFNNAGIKTPSFGTTDTAGNLGTVKAISASDPVQVGDIVWFRGTDDNGNPRKGRDGYALGHVGVVVGIHESNDGFYVAHARSKDNGINIQVFLYSNQPWTHRIDISNYISNHNNLVSNYESIFNNGRLA